jgi:hypothetical protein
MASVVRLICPMFPLPSVNQRFPSGPAAIIWGLLLAVGTANSVIVPVSGLISPTSLPAVSVNQRPPFGPAVIPSG